MSSPMLLAAVSSGIRRILWNSFAADPTVRPLVGTEEAIVFLNPTQTARDSGNRLSLWLYLIAENEFIKNVPPQRVADHTEQFPPLALDLYYLLTPFGPSGEADLLILGRAMQALYDSARTTLINTTAGVAEDLGISLFRRTLDELSRVWEAPQEPYRLSVCYQVRLTRIDSTCQRPRGAGPGHVRGPAPRGRCAYRPYRPRVSAAFLARPRFPPRVAVYFIRCCFCPLGRTCYSCRPAQ